MRLAEMYLTKAEALAHLGKTAEAQEVLTAFAVTRDPSYVSKGNTGDALVQEILTQRRIELWGEGFRWYDLKRLNLPMERTGKQLQDRILRCIGSACRRCSLELRHSEDGA
jgi:hypothetical protein